MRRQSARALLAAGTIAAALSLSVPAATAAGTWTVTGGPSFTAAPAPETTFTLTDTTSNLTFTCTLGVGAGSVIDQSGGTNTAVGQLTGSSFGSSTHKCNGPLGSTGTITQKAGTRATIIVVSYNLSAGIVTLTITGVDFVLTINSLLGTCMAEIKGTLGAIYNNATHLLQFTAAGTNLKVVSTSGACAGILKVNDALTFTTGSGGWIITGSPDAWIEFAQP